MRGGPVVGRGGARLQSRGAFPVGWLLDVGDVPLLACTLQRPLHTSLALLPHAPRAAHAPARIAASWPLMKRLAHFTPSALGCRKRPAVRTVRHELVRLSEAASLPQCCTVLHHL